MWAEQACGQVSHQGTITQTEKADPPTDVIRPDHTQAIACEPDASAAQLGPTQHTQSTPAGRPIALKQVHATPSGAHGRQGARGGDTLR